MSGPVVLEKRYDPRAVEEAVYRKWEESGAFRSHPTDPPTPHERTFTIVIPPPNVTGALHLGHALNNTLQDILVRYHRMRGFNTLWQPGTDHAGIATQAVVERRIFEQEGKTRHDLGREELVRRIWQWKDEYEARILNQLKRMGCSCDWERTRFTLDEGLSRAVREMFFRLFRDGLIFRGKRLVNWDTQLQTAVSDDEVYYETVKGHFWHFRYPVIDPKPGEPPYVVVATTRPETMLGDTAVAVHPDPEGFFKKYKAEQDARFRSAVAKPGSLSKKADQAMVKEAVAFAYEEERLSKLVQLRDMARDGRTIRLPLVEREIPLICDEWADPTKGSGCVKITPAHDPNDYEVGRRHGLAMINVLTPDGRIAPILEPDPQGAPVKPGTRENVNSDRYAGLAFTTEGRQRVVEDMDRRGFLEKVEEHEHEIGHSDRSKLPIEPFLSDQWFVQTGDATVETMQRRGEPAEVWRSPFILLANGTKVKGLAQAAMDAVLDGRIKVFPPRYAKSYLDWLGEKRDWCISRQLWWGHRIPVWQRASSGKEHNDDADDNQVARLLAEGRIASLSTQEPSAPFAETAGDGPAPSASAVEYVCVRDGGDTEAVEALERAGFTQDPDVLDTWFSSALWPFSTLGWPDVTPHLKQYYPGSVLCTSRDIITNWVARMVMFGLYAMGEVPFDHVYIHPKILDGRGETMSKSKGNGVDPVDIIHTHGADALRYTMADMTTETQDIRMPVEYVCPHCGRLTRQEDALKAEQQDRKSRGEKLTRRLQPSDCRRVRCTNPDCGRPFATQWADEETKKALGLGRETSDKFDIGRNFCNKLWNAARFAFMHLKDTPCDRLEIQHLPPEDRWILARLSQTIRRYHNCLENYQFSASVKELREFFWDALCDWYIELTKPRLAHAEGVRDAPNRPTPDAARQVLAFCMDQVLRLWHPTIPFITERLWAQLNELAPRRGLPGLVELHTESLLVSAAFPPEDGYPDLEDERLLETFAGLQDVTRGVRDLRAKSGLSPKQTVEVTAIVPDAELPHLQAHAHIVRHMAGIGELHLSSAGKRPRNAAGLTIRGFRLYLHDVSDDEAERKRTRRALEQLEQQIAGKEKKLANEQFVTRAKPEIVEAERKRLAELLAQRDALRQHLAELAE